MDLLPEDRRLQRRIFWVGLAIRLLYMTLAHTWRIRVTEDHFDFGWEMGRSARALATGYGYADPFRGHTGPTAWSPPLFTLLLAGVFKLFGVYTKLSAWVILSIDCVFSAWTGVAVYEIARRSFNRTCALWSGWIWALHPAAMQYAVRWVWEMSATTCLFAWIFVLAMRMRSEGQTTARWATFGLLWGLLALTSPTPLIVLPVLGLWIVFAPGFRLANPVLAGLIFCAVIAPWAARNWIVFGKFIPLRSNFGAENYLGNGPWSVGFPWGRTVPLENDAILHQYASMGEPAWVADRGAKASAWIKANPSRFAQLSVKRAWMFWAGVPKSIEEGGIGEYLRLISFQFISLAGWMGALLAVRKRAFAAWPMLLSLALVPLTYYFVTVQARFRHVLEPLLCILGVFLFQSAEPGKFGRAVATRFAGLGRSTAALKPFFRGE